MTRGITRSITGLTLSLLMGGSSALANHAYAAPVLDRSSTSDQPLAPVLDPGSAGPSNLLEPPAQPSSSFGAPDAYTLGAGDIVRVDLFETPELVLDQRYTVLLDGTLNLPWIGTVSVQGQTLAQAGETISRKYARFIRKPVITVNLLAPRPLKVGVIGEVNRPGSYIISVISNEVTQTSLNQRSSAEGGNQWPTVSKALQTAGGITQLANIRKVTIRRTLPQGTETLDIDLWKFLQEGDLAQDVLLRDGDTIAIPKATTFDPLEATQVAISNFSPEQIRINVVGEVVTPGPVQLRPNSTLNQAVLAAGGFRPGRSVSRVDLIRLNPDGTVTQRRVKMDLAKNLDQQDNPPLHNNDVIVVRRNFLAKVGDALDVGFRPITQSVGVIDLIRGLFNGN